jgi:hypothetical protein
VNVFLHRGLKFGSLALVAGTLSATPTLAQIRMDPLAKDKATVIRKREDAEAKAVHMLVSFFRGGSPAEAKDAIQLASDIREELWKKDYNELWSVPRDWMNKLLKASNFPPDEPIGVNDLMAMAKSGETSARETVDGTLTKRADGTYQLETQFYYGASAAETEPLPVIVGKNIGALQEEFVKKYWEWRKQLGEYKNCHDALVVGNFDKAVASGRKLMGQKTRGQLAELCLLSGLGGTEASLKANAKEILTLSAAILARDSVNKVPGAGRLAQRREVLEKGLLARPVEPAERPERHPRADAGRQSR